MALPEFPVNREIALFSGNFGRVPPLGRLLRPVTACISDPESRDFDGLLLIFFVSRRMQFGICRAENPGESRGYSAMAASEDGSWWNALRFSGLRNGS
jgi:hypothetical protein